MIIFLGFILFVLLIVLFSGVFIVHQQNACIIERLGKYHRTALAGIQLKIPLLDRKAGEISLRLNQMDLEIETKTLDNVFVKITASIQYRIVESKIYEAFYTLNDPEAQIQSFVFDVIRSCVPRIKLDEVFSKKDDIANSVRSELKEMMNDFGYDILKTLVTDIVPDARVKAAMNEINEAERLRIAATARGEADKTIAIKKAEADAESCILKGKGMAGQRKALIDGLKNSLNDFCVPGSTSQDVMTLILMVQYFDTLKEMGHHGNLNTILMPHSPGAIQDLKQQIQQAILTQNFCAAEPLMPAKNKVDTHS